MSDTLDEAIDKAVEAAEPAVEVSDGEVAKKTPQQLAMEEMERQNNVRMENIVITAREKLLPFLKEQDFSVEESQRVMESLAVTVQQGLFMLMKTTLVETLDLKGKINENYPNYEVFHALLDQINPLTMEDGIEALQWMAKKIDAELKKEQKERKFSDLNLEF